MQQEWIFIVKDSSFCVYACMQVQLPFCDGWSFQENTYTCPALGLWGGWVITEYWDGSRNTSTTSLIVNLSLTNATESSSISLLSSVLWQLSQVWANREASGVRSSLSVPEISRRDGTGPSRPVPSRKIVTTHSPESRFYKYPRKEAWVWLRETKALLPVREVSYILL